MNSLISSFPCWKRPSNFFSLVYKDKETLNFVKHVNSSVREGESTGKVRWAKLVIVLSDLRIKSLYLFTLCTVMNERKNTLHCKVFCPFIYILLKFFIVSFRILSSLEICLWFEVWKNAFLSFFRHWRVSGHLLYVLRINSRRFTQIFCLWLWS